MDQTTKLVVDLARRSMLWMAVAFALAGCIVIYVVATCLQLVFGLVPRRVRHENENEVYPFHLFVASAHESPPSPTNDLRLQKR